MSSSTEANTGDKLMKEAGEKTRLGSLATFNIFFGLGTTPNAAAPGRSLWKERGRACRCLTLIEFWRSSRICRSGMAYTAIILSGRSRVMNWSWDMPISGI